MRWYIAESKRRIETDDLEGHREFLEMSGERVPYPVEAYPEGNMKHLSAESALYCRVITDGLLNIVSDGNVFSCRENLPFLPNGVTLKNVYINGEYRNIKIR